VKYKQRKCEEAEDWIPLFGKGEILLWPTILICSLGKIAVSGSKAQYKQ